MERAGAAVARVVLERFPGARRRRLRRRLERRRRPRRGARAARARARRAVVERGGRARRAGRRRRRALRHRLPRARRGPRRRALIEQINARGAPVVAVDVPSGVDASTGEVPGAAVRRDVTVTMQAREGRSRRRAGPLPRRRGRRRADRARRAETRPRSCRPRSSRVVPRKGERDDKYRAGSVLVVGGSRGLTGAPCLAAEAAFRADAGYVTVAAPEATMPVVEARLLEAVKRPLPEDASRREARADACSSCANGVAVALGPGLGRGAEPRALVRAPARRARPAGRRRRRRALRARAGRRARRRGADAARGRARRACSGACRTGSRRTGSRRCAARGERSAASCLLKGADTLVAAPGRGVLVSALGPPSLATAGTGDVLTGIVAAFLAKGMEPRLAAAAAAAVHGAGGVAAQPQAGLVASDLIAAIPRALAGRRDGSVGA